MSLPSSLAPAAASFPASSLAGEPCALSRSIPTDVGILMAMADEIGQPAGLIHLYDYLFESLARAPRQEWPIRRMEAVAVVADLTSVLDRWFVWLLEEELGEYPTSAPVAQLYRRRLAGEEPTLEEWRAAARAAERAARAAWSRREEWAGVAAERAGWCDAVSAGWWASMTARESATEDAERAAAMAGCITRMSDTLIALLRDPIWRLPRVIEEVVTGAEPERGAGAASGATARLAGHDPEI